MAEPSLAALLREAAAAAHHRALELAVVGSAVMPVRDNDGPVRLVHSLKDSDVALARALALRVPLPS
ncbi:hypothetical protein SAMN05216328_12963 [Ensifer sp. YR511]|nr:hypothetical protein SAMN05216328_12963 [Ensifer sp. YR511]